jgi:hypothetical protein
LGQHHQRPAGRAVIDVSVVLEVTPTLVRFQRIAGRFSDFKPVLGGRVDVASRRLIRRMFATQGRASGRGQWAPLTERYVRQRRQFPTRPLLRQTDAMYEALTVRGHPDQETILERDRYAITVAEDATDDAGRSIRARFVGHQRGVPESGVPARPMIPDPLPKTFIDEVRRAVRAYIVRGER